MRRKGPQWRIPPARKQALPSSEDAYRLRAGVAGGHPHGGWKRTIAPRATRQPRIGPIARRL